MTAHAAELPTVLRRCDLVAMGVSPATVDAQLTARRWRRCGAAIVTHNGPLPRPDAIAVALVNSGPRAVTTSFTALEILGLRGWEREPIHVLVPSRRRLASVDDTPVVTHYLGGWPPRRAPGSVAAQSLVDAAVIAASSFASARVGTGLLAATVAQRLTRPRDLAAAIDAAVRTRHRAVFRQVVDDIGQGAHALSELDFGRLCRGAGLPEPARQAVRCEPDGRRRYLDAQWRRADGPIVSAEVDGALHLVPKRWWADQLRQNELVIAGDLLLRFPSVVLRTERRRVVDQLRRAIA